MMRAPDRRPTADFSAEIEVKDALLHLADTKPLEVCAHVVHSSVTFEFDGKTWRDRQQAMAVLIEELSCFTFANALGIDGWHEIKEVCARHGWTFRVSYASEQPRA